MRGITRAEFLGAIRSLRRAPTVTVCAIVCLAIGIGATTAMWSAISRALLQPLPFREPDRLVSVHRITPASGPNGGWPHSAPNYVDLARATRQLESLAATSWGSAVIDVRGEAFQSSQQYVTGNFFPTLGARPELGRFLTSDDDRAGAPRVGVLSDEQWRARFGADPSVIGRVLSIDGIPTTIVGIAPRDFRVPVGSQVLHADLWSPLRFTPDQLAQRRSNYLLAFGRLARGATVESAQNELRGIFANLVREYPALSGDNIRVAPLHAESVRSLRKPLLLLFGAVCLVLLIAATNVAALLLSRGVQRQREMAVRSALGASRGDALRPVLLESLILSLVSVGIGIALAAAGVKSIGMLAAQRMPQLAGLAIDARVLAFGLVVAIVVAIVCGAAPALRASRVDPQDALRGGRGGGSGRDQHRALRTLVILEISLSVVLLIGAGLVLKGFASLIGLDPGFDASRILTLRITVQSSKYPGAEGVTRFLEPAVTAIENVPGVEAAATIGAIPYQNWGINTGIRYEGMPRGEETRWPIVEQRLVSTGFFDVTKQKLISGRLLDSRDGADAPVVVVVNQALIRRDFAGADPVGKRFHLSDTSFATIVGVVSDIRNMGPFTEIRPEMYSDMRQFGSGAVVFPMMIRVRSGDPAGVLSGVRRAIAGVDPMAALSNEETMPEIIARSLGQPRFYFLLLSAFGAIAVILAVAGLYGVLSYAVAQRTRELGIRSALGASRAGLVRLVAAEGTRLVVVGLVFGLAGGAAATRFMQFMLYGVSPLDATAWVGASLLMVGAAALAVVVPARRAARVSPLVAMQTE
jgi:predicted permease